MIAKNYGAAVYNEVPSRIHEVFERIVGEDAVSTMLHEIIEPALQKRKQALDEELCEIYHPYPFHESVVSAEDTKYSPTKLD